MKHLKYLFVGLVLSLVAVSLSAQDGSFIKFDTNEQTFSSVTDPITLTGTCSKDIQTIEVKLFTADSYSYDEKFTEVDSYVLKRYVPGSLTFKYDVFPSLENLFPGTNKYQAIAKTKDGTVVKTETVIYYHQYFGERSKPVIYLYPLKETKLTVNVFSKTGFTTTIPEHGTGWKVTAFNDGKIINDADSKEYPYLFWEAPAEKDEFLPTEGFSVKREDLTLFFTEKLLYLGLSKKEADDFLEYWIPLLVTYPYYTIAFTDQKTLDAINPLTISPSPDTVIRVFFDQRGTPTRISIPSQKLIKRERKGFVVSEWGGRRY